MADFVQTVAVVVMLIVLSAVMFLELRYMRSRRAARSGDLELPDRAHNAILTTKAIRDTLERGGVHSPAADDVIREAEAAYRERSHRVAIELADRAKGILQDAKRRQREMGDLAKLDRIQPKGEAEETTAKEKLTKELPPNYTSSRFTMGLAREEIDAARAQGRDAGEAERRLVEAQRSFDAGDYDAALREAVHARRALEDASPAPAPAPVAAPTAAAVGTLACVACDARIAEQDAFCRKCGAKAPVPRRCPSCGAPVPADDAFCRKCGARMPQVNP